MSRGVMGIDVFLNPGFQFVLVSMEWVLVSNMKSNSANRLVELGKLKTAVHKLLVLDVLVTLAQ